MTLSRDAIAARVRRLAMTLGDLTVRVREAVATETGKAVAEAVKDLLCAALRETGPHYPGRDSPYAARHHHWDPDDSGWDDDRDDEPNSIPQSRSSPAWPTVMTLTVAVAKQWAARRLPAWVAVAAGLAVGAAAVVGGPLLHAGLALAGAASDLFPHLLSNSIRI